MVEADRRRDVASSQAETANTLVHADRRHGEIFDSGKSFRSASNANQQTPAARKTAATNPKAASHQPVALTRRGASTGKMIAPTAPVAFMIPKIWGEWRPPRSIVRA